jgi:signal transduction histidine kinase/CheY-like chemotaxis protein
VHRDRHARPAPGASLLTLLTAAYVAVYLAYIVWSESPGWETGPLVHGIVTDLGFLPVNLLIAAVFWLAARRAAQYPGTTPSSDAGRESGASQMLARALRLVALQSALTAVGDVAWWYVDIVQGRDAVNSWANGIYLASYAVMLAALVSMPRGRRAKLEWWKFALDAATVLLGGAIVIGVVVLWPRTSAHPGGGTLSIELAYPLADLLMLLGITTVALRPTGRPPAPLILLLVSQLACITSDVLYTIVFLAGTGPDVPSTPVWSTGLLAASYVLLIASGEWYRRAPAPEPGLTDPAAPGVDGTIESMHPISPLPYIAAAGAAALLVFLAWQSWPAPLSVLVIAAVPVFALIAIRGVLSSHQNVALLTENAARSAESRIRSQLHGQLVHAQRMEAVGQLAGGVAHDFNNILTAISGNAELAMGSLPPDAAARDDLDEIRAGVTRAATLTRQLLAFSRRQTLHPRVVDLNAVVAGCEPMLGRLIGEHIRLETHLARNISPILADPGQIEQVLVNLVVNSRDAMPGGGRVQIETTEVVIAVPDPIRWPGLSPARYVRLAVRDTGSGMDRDTRKRAFEPFFTTKAQGKGTGLGLATVYGIITQSEGSIFIDSEPGIGTTVAAYFRPTAAKASSALSPVSPSASRPVTGKGETILVVEDESAVREPLARALRQQGYVVLEAEDGVHGLEVSAQHAHAIDLVVSDVRMPRLIGPDMVAQLRAERPGLRAMFVSGYTSFDRGVPAPLIAAQLLEKPFTLPTLFRRVRAALDGPLPEYPDRASDPGAVAAVGAAAGIPDEEPGSL